MESYEQKYREALGRMMKSLYGGLYGGLHGKTKEEAEKYFTELKESEDERVKKELIELISCMHDADPRKKGWIAWLEKQGEKKPLSAAENLAKAVTDAHPTFNFKVGLPDEDECPKWFEKQGEKPHGKTALEMVKEEKSPVETLGISPEEYERMVNECIYGESTDKLKPKFKVKYAGNEYNVFETKDIAGVTFYGIEDEPNHIDYVKAENCEIISVYAIKENGSPYPTKPAVFSEKKPKRMISAEAKECIYGSDNEQVSSEKIGKNDTLLDLLQKMPSCITVDGIDYHFVMAKHSYYIAYYKAIGEDGRGNAIFGMTAYSPIDLLTEMLEKLKKEGLLK